MRYLANRIIVSILAVIFLAYLWEFWVKPETSPLYTAAVAEYKAGHYERSLELLRSAYRIDPNDSAILTLMGWDFLKLRQPDKGEPFFRRGHELSPDVVDLTLGYAYTEIELKKYPEADELMADLRKQGVQNADYLIALGTLKRREGNNLEAAQAFKRVLDVSEKNPVAIRNLQEIFSTDADVSKVSLSFPPLVRAATLTYPARVVGDHFEWQESGTWKPVYLTGMDLAAALPGHFPVEAATDTALYHDWFQKMTDLGINTIRVYAIMPPAFYRSLYDYNSAGGHAPLRLLQGVSFGPPPPRDDMFNHDYYEACRRAVRDAIDVAHGQGDVRETPAYPGGLYPNDISPWVAGLLLGQAWLSHVITGNNLLHPDLRDFHGTYIDVPSGNATEVFLAQMINYAAEYEEGKYNTQRPLAFATWPTLDPMRHETESTILEEVSIRRGLGEHIPTPEAPYDDDDSVSVDPLHLRPSARLAAGYFAAYSVFPFYPDFMIDDPKYLSVRDEQGSDPFLGYLQDLKASTKGIPLVISEYGIPSSMGIGHLSPVGFDQGGKTEPQQGDVLARLTRNVYDAGAAGGFVFEWMDEWFRQTWLVSRFEVPTDRHALWDNYMDPAQFFGVIAAVPKGTASHTLTGEQGEWAGKTALYAAEAGKPTQPLGDRYDPARKLKALYVDADEGFLYLRLVVDKLDNDGDGQPDWANVNYLIGLATSPQHAGLTSLPFIVPMKFPMGMTYAIQLAGPDASRILIASTYDPYQLVPVEGLPSQNALQPRLGWKPRVSETGTYEAQILEPNRRRFGRDGRYFPPQRYDRGMLRYGSLDLKSPDYDSLAEWHANVRTNTVDVRIPWNLLNVTDPSSFQVFAGFEKDGTVDTLETTGILPVVFSYKPLESARTRPPMDQNLPVADSLPAMTSPDFINAKTYKYYRWNGWNTPQYDLRMKESYAILRKALQALPATPPGPEPAGQRIARAGVPAATARSDRRVR